VLKGELRRHSRQQHPVARPTEKVDPCARKEVRRLEVSQRGERRAAGLRDHGHLDGCQETTPDGGIAPRPSDMRDPARPLFTGSAGFQRRSQGHCHWESQCHAGRGKLPHPPSVWPPGDPWTVLVKRLALLALLVATPAFASVALRMDVPALTAAATDVVDGTVVSSAAVWTSDHRRIVTHVVVEVREAWKGNARGRITVVQPGGELDGLGQRVSGVAELPTGARMVLFLERSGAMHRVVGLAQGVYRVVPGDGTAETRAVPASLDGLELVAPAGGETAARAPLPVSALRASVKAAVQ
jgi:hypothetical protein